MKLSLQTIFLLLYLLIYAHTSTGQNSPITDKYDLKFDFQKNKSTSWVAEPFFPMRLSFDSSQTINGKYPLYFVQKTIDRFPVGLLGLMQQRILLPESKADSITVSLNCKSLNLQISRLVISGMNEKERVLYSDTLQALGADEWKTYSRTIALHNAVFLHLSIQAKGIYLKSVQSLSLDKIEIKLDGKDINEFPLKTIPTIPDINQSGIISLSLRNNDAFKKIPELESQKIVAIGETTHGSETINETAVQLIKYQVENNHCKLILLELPTEEILQLNRCIQGDTLFKIENINNVLKECLFSPRVMIDLFNWLKQYNANRTDKTWLLGMDLGLSTLNSAKSLFEYIEILNKYKKNILLDSLSLQLKRYSSFTKALQFLEKHSEIEELLGKTDYEIFHYCLNMSINAGDNSDNRFYNRDKQMYLNTTFLMTLLCQENEKTIIYTHFLHSNYISQNPSFIDRKSFGTYMKSKFGDDFYTLAVLTGEGNFRTGDKDSLFVKRDLKSAPVNSLENLFMRTNEELCFMPVTKLTNTLTYMRLIGNKYQENQFSIIAPAERMGGIIFVRNSNAFNLLPGTLTTVRAAFNSQIEKMFKITDNLKKVENKIKPN